VSDFSAAFEEVLAALDRLEIPFLIDGSGSGDIDVVGDIAPKIVAQFCAALAPNFYSDAGHAELAVRGGRAFNVIHLKSAYKFDIFPAGADRFAHSQLARRHYITTTVPGLESVAFPVASGEDTILDKLVSFRKRGEVSDSDILGVIRVQAGRLDLGYLREWAGELGVGDLLRRALDG
jgi:hypothetical protein